MREEVDFTCKGFGDIEMWDDFINNFRIFEESFGWN